MKCSRALWLVLVLLAVLAPGEARRNRKLKSTENSRTDFDFFLLVRQWPATFCNDHSCTHRPPSKFEFTVHGLWPQRRDGTWPEYCKPSSHVRMDDLDDLLDELEHDWPSWSGADETFWDHEWSRHGTCAATVMGGQHRFFSTVLGLHHRFNIQAALSRAGIRPSNSRKYPVQDIKNAIDDMYGVLPHINCDGNGALTEIWMCINKKLKPIDCVDAPRSSSARAAGSAATATTLEHLQQSDSMTSAPVPPNYNCKMVTIPKLQRHWGKVPDLTAVGDVGVSPKDLQEEDQDADVAHAEAFMQVLDTTSIPYIDDDIDDMATADDSQGGPVIVSEQFFLQSDEQDDSTPGRPVSMFFQPLVVSLSEAVQTIADTIQQVAAQAIAGLDGQDSVVVGDIDAASSQLAPAPVADADAAALDSALHPAAVTAAHVVMQGGQMLVSTTTLQETEIAPKVTSGVGSNSASQAADQQPALTQHVVHVQHGGCKFIMVALFAMALLMSAAIAPAAAAAAARRQLAARARSTSKVCSDGCAPSSAKVFDACEAKTLLVVPSKA